MTKQLVFIFIFFFSTISKANIGDELASPVTTDAKYYLYGGTIATVLLVTVGQNFMTNIQNQFVQNKPFGNFSQFGDISGTGVWNGAYALGMLTHYWISSDKKSLERADYMFRTSVYSTAATYVLKYSIQEPRPDNPDQKDSMPSGHSSMAFSFASVVTQEHGWWWGGPAYGLATFVAFSRINDNRHRLSDTVAGATIGVSYGLGLFYNRQKNLETNSMFQVLPTDDLSGLRIEYGMNF
jgi:membrane-associated phospholipid phosphatase